ncbi:MAG: Holliday junction branch migration protein RuvA [Desulfobulbaceae bacterium]|nr:Holliday junction branch migration protein RuvA [Desulfobulbaceae bacterium]
MIACLKGEILFKSPEKLILDVGGVGYEVFFPESSHVLIPEIGQETFLHIHTHVREDTLMLYGFLDIVEKETFLMLLGVSGVGPKLALSILSGITPGEFCRAISSDDLPRLISLSGIGKKKAERLCLELKDKVQFIPVTEDAATSVAVMGQTEEHFVDDAVSAMVNLGYPRASAEQAVRAACQQESPSSLEELLRLALRTIG